MPKLIWLSLLFTVVFPPHSFARPTSALERATSDPPSFEYTALGDSYATGVGAGDMIEEGQCMRFSQAYPQQLNASADIPGDPAQHRFNNAACSGATGADVMQTQFADVAYFDPRWGSRPAFGHPLIATLSVGGDDIGFPKILQNCVYEIIKDRTCPEQLEDSWTKIRSPEFGQILDSVMSKAMEKGKAGPAGENFQLFVTGYADFFNVDTDECNSASFSIQHPWGNDTYLTKELRTTFNDMSNALNNAIAAAVARQGKGVHFVNWDSDGALDGHRFCEPGVSEPDLEREETWFWHFPYDQWEGQRLLDIIAKTWDPTVSTSAEFEAKHADHLPPVAGDLQTTSNALYALAQNANKTGLPWSLLGDFVRVFHPTIPAHEHIKNSIFGQYRFDSEPAAGSSPSVFCRMNSGLFEKSFEIMAADFDDTKFKDCAGLYDAVKKQSEVHDWSCSKVSDANWQWKASGSVPIDAGEEIWKAIVEAGGPSAAACLEYDPHRV